MKQIKRVFSMLLILVLLFTEVDWPGSLGLTAYADNVPTQGSTSVAETPDELLTMGEWRYWVEDGQAIVAGYEDSKVTSLQIPAHLGGYPVTGIGKKAFSANTELRSIQIPTNVTKIADDAFAGLKAVMVRAYHGAYAHLFATSHKFQTVDLSTECVFANGVIDLSGLPDGSYYDLSEESVSFKADEVSFLSVGQIINFPETPGYPTGLTKRVERITRSGDQITAYLSQPEWGECFELVSGEDTLLFDWDNIIIRDSDFVIDEYDAAGWISKSRLMHIETEDGSELELDLKLNFGEPVVEYEVGTKLWYGLLVPEIKMAAVDLPVNTDIAFKISGSTKMVDPHSNRHAQLIKRNLFDLPVFSVMGVINGYVSVGVVVELEGEFAVSATINCVYHFEKNNGKTNKSIEKHWNNLNVEIQASLKAGPTVSAELVLGWKSFNISFFSASIGAYLKLAGTAKRTSIHRGTQPSIQDVDASLHIVVEYSVKIGLIKYEYWDPIKRQNKERFLEWYYELKGSFGPWYIFHGHWEDGKKVSNCTLEDRNYKYQVDGKTINEGTADVNNQLPQPTLAVPYKERHVFRNWYVDTKASGLPGSDYIYDFARDVMPYCGPQGTLIIYAKFDPVPVNSVTLNKSSETIYTNDKNGVQLSATVKPANAADTSVIWTSSNNKVATVNNKGKVTPVAAGTATITCTSKSNSSVKATFTITVKQYVEKVTVSAGTNEIFQGETLQLQSTVSPNDASNKSLNWSSSNPAVATVDQNGKVSGVTSGSAVITATAKDRNTISGEFNINILLPVTGIALDKTSAVIYTNNTVGLQLIPALTPTAASLSSVKWETSNSSAATVDQNGLVKPVAPGTATITCRSKSDNTVTAVCTITVKQYVESIAVSGSLASIVVGDTLQLSTSVGPSNATDKSLSWSSSNTSVATVSSSGVITGVGSGSAVITATANDGSGVTDSYKVVVVAIPTGAPAVPVTGVSVSSNAMTVYTVNKTAQVSATISPSNADASMIWASGNESTATIDNTGKITMIKGGTTILTGRSAVDPSKYVNINLRVVQSVENIEISGTNQIEEISDSTVLTAIVGPDNAENKGVSWSWTTVNGGEVTIDQNGKVTAVANGVVEITATAVDGSGVSSSFNLKVGKDPIPVETITLDETSISKYTNEKDGVQLFPTVLPVYADDLSVIWSSSDDPVASVDDNGRITFIAPGKATITCRSVNNPNVTATCEVTVKQYVEQIVVDSDKGALLPGNTAQLTATVYPSNASDKSLTWSSGNTAIATVDQNGKVMAKAPGTVEITATAKDGSGASAKYTVMVEKELQLEVSVINDTVFTQGTEICDLAYINLTSSSVRRMVEAGHELTWSMVRKSGNGDTSLVVLNTSLNQNGHDYNTTAAVLRGSSFPNAGTEVYTVTCSAGGYNDSVDVTITVDGAAYSNSVKLTSASVGSNTFAKGIGETALVPSTPFSVDGNAVPTGMRCSISGDRYYAENATEIKTDSGLSVSFEKSGMYPATIRYTKGNLAYEVAATFNVTDADGVVRLRVEDITLSNSFLSLVEGSRATLTATVSPNDAYNSAVTWSSSDTTVATVTSNGVVTGIAPGSALITCTAKDGSGQTAICSVTVESYLQLDDSELTYAVYNGGEKHADLGIVNVTIDSQQRLITDGLNVSWSLDRISGTSTELGLNEYTTVGEDGLSVSGNMFKLLRINGVGTDEYRLTCTAGHYSDSCEIYVTVKDGLLPSTVNLKTSSYSTSVDTWLAIDTRNTLLPSNSMLPLETVIGIDGGTAFWDAVSGLYSYAEPDKLIFEKAGTYTAYVTFCGDNYNYRCPITISVADKDGVVPPTITDVNIVGSDEPILMTTGDFRTLSIEVEPTNANYSEVSWSSTNTAVATVSSTGKVTAIGSGYATIVARIPESDYEGTCLIYVEEGINFRSNELERTVFIDGETRMTLDTMMLTDNTSSRLNEAPEWTLRRVSGTSLTLRAVPVESVNTQGMTLYGCDLILYSVSKEGDTIYELTCASGNETKTATITVHAAYRDRLLPASISLDQTVYTADIGELILVQPMVSTYPAGSILPNGILVSCEGSTQYQEAINAADTYVSQSLSTFSFSKAGTYEVNFIYAYSNMKYVVPVTFRIRDANGNVPVQASRMALNQQSLYMTIGETNTLEAVFTPADATNQAVTWSSSDPSIATVSADGTVTAVSNGTAYISCTPSDQECETVECAVTVEDYLTVESGANTMTLYIQGEQQNNIAAVQLSEGTIERLAAAGITPTWTVNTNNVTHAVLDTDVGSEEFRVLVNTRSLKNSGTDRYQISCSAGQHTWSQQYTLKVSDLGSTAPESVTIRNTEVLTTVNTPVTVDFTPIITPSGATLPTGMVDTGFVGVGRFYSALDMSSYSENGDLVTLAFTRPGQYLLTRRYMLSNLQYVTACTITVGDDVSGRNVLEATETSYTVYSGGRSGVVSTVRITDAILYQLWEKELSWQIERVSGDSMNIALKENGDSVDVFVSSVEKNGTDIWRVSCSFGGMTESVDITITAADPRGPLPESVSLATDMLSGMIGNWINLPLGVSCSPSGSLLPDQGDEFWSFRFDQAGEERSSHVIENGMLRVRFTVSGYYTGTLTYKSGNVSYSIPVYFAIRDEEQEVRKPNLDLYAVNTFDTVYPEGETGISIGQMVMAESLSTYSTGAAVAFLKDASAVWKVTKSGTAAVLSLKKVSDNVYDLILNQINGSGDVSYTVKCTVDGKTYAVSKTLHVAGNTEARPDATLPRTAYQAEVGEEVDIDSRMLSRADGSILQSSTELDPTNLLAAVGYEIKENHNTWTMTFYQEGTYNASVSGYVSNLKVQLPIVIVVSEKGSETAMTVLKFPSALTSIEAEAFEGSTAIVIDLRGTKIKTIGTGAFRYCVDASMVYLPNSVTYIADDAFYGCINAKFCCEAASYAANWAAIHNFSVVEP